MTSFKEINNSYNGVVRALESYWIAEDPKNEDKTLSPDKALKDLTSHLRYFMADRDNVIHLVSDKQYQELTHFTIKKNDKENMSHYGSIQYLMLNVIEEVKKKDPELATDALAKIINMGHASDSIAHMFDHSGGGRYTHEPAPLFGGWQQTYMESAHRLMVENKDNAKIVEAAGSLLMAYSDQDMLSKLEKEFIPNSKKYNNKDHYNKEEKIIEKLGMLANQEDAEIGKFAMKLLMQKDVLRYSKNMDKKYINRNPYYGSIDQMRRQYGYTSPAHISIEFLSRYINNEETEKASPKEKQAYALAAAEIVKYMEYCDAPNKYPIGQFKTYCREHGTEETKNEISKNPDRKDKLIGFANNDVGYLSFSALKKLKKPTTIVRAGAGAPNAAKRHPDAAHAI